MAVRQFRVTEEQRIALGFRPRTLRGWWFYLRYWSPPAIWFADWRLRRKRAGRSSPKAGASKNSC